MVKESSCNHSARVFCGRLTNANSSVRRIAPGNPWSRINAATVLSMAAAVFGVVRMTGRIDSFTRTPNGVVR
jgi:hypothetical protein